MRAERVQPTALRGTTTLARRIVDGQRRDPSSSQITLRALMSALPLASPHAAGSAQAVLTAAVDASTDMGAELSAQAVALACSLVSPYPDEVPIAPEGDEPAAVGRLAAALVRAGVDAPESALEGRHGLLVLLGSEQPEPATAPPLASPIPLNANPPRLRSGSSVTRELAGWAAAVGAEALPLAASEAARTMLGNIGALVVAGLQTPTLQRLATELPSTAGIPLPMLASASPRPAADAALLYGIAAHLEDFDDTHLASVAHPGSCAVPAALAMWPGLHPSGEDLLAAVAVGAEVAIRLGTVLEPALRRGWHLSGLVAPVAAAAVAGRLLGLNARGLAAAMGTAATRASGITEALGTLAKSVHLGHAAAVGVRAAMHASRGTHVPDDRSDPIGRLLDALGVAAVPASDDEWRIQRNQVKPYACGVLGHTAIDLAADLRRCLGGQEPSELLLRVSPLAMQAMGRPAPTPGLEAKFSLAHAVAVGLVRGTGDPVDFTQAAVDDPAVRRATERVQLIADDRHARFEARLSATWPSGEIVLHAAEPRALDAAGVRAKVDRLLAPALGERAAPVARSLLTDDLDEFGALWQLIAHHHLNALHTTDSEALQ